MKFILGQKMGMSQIFNEKGEIAPITLVKVGPCVVLQIKTLEKDGYEAVQVGFGEKKIKNIRKPLRGHFKKIKNPRLRQGFGGQAKSKIQNTDIRWLREFRIEKPGSKLGDEITADDFKEGDVVNVSGLSKGKGFQGVVKRHGFRGGPKSHGQKHSLRAPGSIGASWPERVAKGKKMAGRMGNERVTVKNLEIVKVDKENNLLAIKGAVPGRKGTLLEIKTS